MENRSCSCLGNKYTAEKCKLIGSYQLKNSDESNTVSAGFITDSSGKSCEVIILGKSEITENTEVTLIAAVKEISTDRDVLIGVPEKHAGTPICYECNLTPVLNNKYQIIDVLYEKTCGAVMFTEKEGQRLYLLIKNDSGHIGFPKGHVESGETETETAVREVMEETALKAEPIDGFRMSYSYRNKTGHEKTAVYFLSHYDYTAAVIQQEEISDSWLLPYDEAVKMLNYPQDIPILENAEKFLSGN